MKVQLLNVGWFTTAVGLWRRDEEEPKRRARFPVPAYLIETETERILVDTGLNPAAVADPEAHYGPGLIAFFELEQEESLAKQVDLSSLSMVVLTHLHFDHAGGLALIPDSVPVVVQRAEWEAGQDRAGIERNMLMPRDYAEAPANLVLVDGGHDLLGDGSIELLSTPGHTVGHQSVRVGDIVIGGDVVHYAATLDDRRFPSFGHDLGEQDRSAERLCELRDSGLTILPGHDPEALRPGPLPV